MYFFFFELGISQCPLNRSRTHLSPICTYFGGGGELESPTSYLLPCMFFFFFSSLALLFSKLRSISCTIHSRIKSLWSSLVYTMYIFFGEARGLIFVPIMYLCRRRRGTLRTRPYCFMLCMYALFETINLLNLNLNWIWTITTTTTTTTTTTQPLLPPPPPPPPHNHYYHHHHHTTITTTTTTTTNTFIPISTTKLYMPRLYIYTPHHPTHYWRLYITQSHPPTT